MNLEEKTVDSECIYNGKILKLKRDTISLPNGVLAKREIVEHNGGSAILCIKNSKVLLVNQFRYAYKECIWEIPAGKINAGESPIDTAYRELEEECGIKAKKLEQIFEIYPSPGYTNEKIRVFIASDLEDGITNFDEDENLISKWIEIDKLKEMVNNGEIKDSKTIIALQYVFSRGLEN